MTKAEFDKLLRLAGQVAHEREFYLIGSQALRGVCPSIPRDFPQTLEADLYPRNRPEAWTILRQKLGRSSGFFREHGCYLDCTDPAVATLPEGRMRRLVPYRSARTGGVTAWCLEPHDLFVSKLVTGRDKDLAFIRSMLLHRLVRLSLTMRRIKLLSVSRLEKRRALEMLRRVASEAKFSRKRLRGK